MAATRRSQSSARRHARELANTPVADPYRGALHDPYTPESPADYPSQPAADDLADFGIPARYAMGLRENAPRAAVSAGILSIALGAFAAIFGFALIAAVALSNSLANQPDRSFYRGADAAHVVLGLLDFALSAAGVLGGVGLLTGRLAGRLALTVFGWAMLAESFYWMDGGRAKLIIPILVAVSAAALLMLSYHRSVTRWLGVLPPPQPE